MLNRRVLTVLAMTAAAAGSLSFASAASAAPAMGTVRGAGEDGALKDRYIVVLKDGSTTTSDALAGKVGGSVSTRFNSTVKGFSGEMSSTAAAARRRPGRRDVRAGPRRADRGDHADERDVGPGPHRPAGAAAERDLLVRAGQQRHGVHHRHRPAGDPHGVRRAGPVGLRLRRQGRGLDRLPGSRHTRRRHGRAIRAGHCRWRRREYVLLLLHVGHVRLLRQAAAQGDLPDRRPELRRQRPPPQGPETRPINPEDARAECWRPSNASTRSRSSTTTPRSR